MEAKGIWSCMIYSRSTTTTTSGEVSHSASAHLTHYKSRTPVVQDAADAEDGSSNLLNAQQFLQLLEPSLPFSLSRDFALFLERLGRTFASVQISNLRSRKKSYLSDQRIFPLLYRIDWISTARSTDECKETYESRVP